MIRPGLRDIPLNDYAKSILKEAEWFLRPDIYKSVHLQCASQIDKTDYYTSEEYMRKIMKEGEGHDGFPEIIVGHSMGRTNLRFDGDYTPDLASKMGEVNIKLQEVNAKLAQEFTLKQNALFCIYPPNGYISWHNNANAPAYNFIFTWSETGDGWFKWYDMEKEEVVTIPDKKGWQCKAGYFGPYSEGRKGLCYHAARTDCLRMTIAYTLERGDVSKGLQDWIIEDIAD